MFGLGTPEILLVLILVLVLFGGAKLPQMMKGMGEGLREFKKATREDEPASTTPSDNESRRTPV